MVFDRGAKVGHVPLEYLAGLFDGEGCVVVQCRQREDKRHYSLQVSLSLVNKNVVELFRSAFGGGIYFVPRRQPHRQDIWHWKIGCKAGYEALRAIFPWLIIKRQQVRLAQEFQALIRPQNNRGVALLEEEIQQREYFKRAISLLNRGKDVAG
ncbi:MAG: hypothetical protein KGJ90_01825 [Patescibacteria group bacterium]|nr:hypothetical protein [Patescibacteria group bacterium]